MRRTRGRGVTERPEVRPGRDSERECPPLWVASGHLGRWRGLCPNCAQLQRTLARSSARRRRRDPSLRQQAFTRTYTNTGLGLKILVSAVRSRPSDPADGQGAECAAAALSARHQDETAPDGVAGSRVESSPCCLPTLDGTTEAGSSAPVPLSKMRARLLSSLVSQNQPRPDLLR